MERTRSELIKKLIRTEELSLQEAQILGDTSQANPNLPFQYIIRGDKFLGSWYKRQEIKNVAPISSLYGNYIAKLTNNQHNLNPEVKNFEIGNKINIPLVKCHGKRNIYDVSSKTFKEAIILDRVYGKTISDIYNSTDFKDKKSKRKIENIEEKYSSILKDTEEHFEVGSDAYYNGENAIIEDITQKIILIDPERWIFKIHNP